MAPKQTVKNGRPMWLLDLRCYHRGRKWFDTEDKAKRFLARVLVEQAQFGAMAWDLPHETRLEYLRVQQRLVKLGITADEAIDWYERTHCPSGTKLVADAVTECLAAKTATGKRKRSVQQLSYALRSFAASVGPVACSDVTTAQIESWLDNPDWGMRTRQGRLVDVRTFFSFAIRRGWALTDPGARVEPISIDYKPPGILTVAQVRRLLEACRKVRPAFLPFIALGVFAGVRPDEIKLLDWKWINLKTGYCEIPAAIAKDRRQRRLIALQPNCIAWLRLGGDLPPVGWQDRFDVVRKAAGFGVSVKRKGKRIRAKGDAWLHDAMRHSFCSYSLPIHGASKTSEWAGHSEAMLFRHYRELVTVESAREFWAVMP